MLLIRISQVERQVAFLEGEVLWWLTCFVFYFEGPSSGCCVCVVANFLSCLWKHPSPRRVEE